jgi:nucleoside-diphosphate-sugar epimerase
MSEPYFVTGALGCIGAWVVKTLVERGDAPIVFDLGTDARRIADVVEPDAMERVRFVRGDITDAADVRRAVEASRATRILHLAGLQVPFCRADPAAGARVNVLGTIHVLEAAKAVGAERVVYASSAAVYGPPEDERAPDESAPCVPTTHYGVYKRANEDNARVYWQDDGLSSVGLRPLTVYGVGRDQGMTSGPTRAMKAAVVGRAFHIPFRGATDFHYVADTAAAFVACADRAPRGAHVYNLHGQSVDVAEIVARIEALVPAARGLITFGGAPIPIPPALDGGAIHEAIEGLPSTPLDDGIRWTIERFRELERRGRLDTRDLDGA